MTESSFSCFLRIERYRGETMLTQKELNYITTFKQTHLHRFREIEAFVKLCKKSLKQPSQADNSRSF